MKTKRSEKIKALKLNFLAEYLEDFVNRVNKDPYKAIDWWIEKENQEIKRSSELRRLNSAKLGTFTPCKDFQWSWPSSPRDLKTQIMNLIENDFIAAKRNILFFGAEGVGKTNLAKILAQHAILNGYSAAAQKYPYQSQFDKGRDCSGERSAAVFSSRWTDSVHVRLKIGLS